jgi:hypothetical protein
MLDGDLGLRHDLAALWMPIARDLMESKLHGPRRNIMDIMSFLTVFFKKWMLLGFDNIPGMQRYIGQLCNYILASKYGEEIAVSDVTNACQMSRVTLSHIESQAVTMGRIWVGSILAVGDHL